MNADEPASGTKLHTMKCSIKAVEVAFLRKQTRLKEIADRNDANQLIYFVDVQHKIPILKFFSFSIIRGGKVELEAGTPR